MIPKFPEFKKLELSDREDIESVTVSHIPYSDFVFENMWAWNIKGKTMVSELNGNLVVILEDVFTSNPICSFMGNNLVNETISNLISLKENKPEVFDLVGLVPEISLDGIDLDKFFIEIDLNSSDYVFSIENLSTYGGHKFYKKRKLHDTFLEKYKDIEVVNLDITEQKVKEQIIGLNNVWSEHKNNSGLDLVNYSENEALIRLFELNVDNLSTIGVLYKQRLIGYIISKVLHGRYAVGLFGKFDRSFSGLNEFMMSKCAQSLLKFDCAFYNAGEDLGLQGLRISKNSYIPVTILRKYRINKL